MMAINFRGRAGGCEGDDVGNYEGAVSLTRGDYKMPAQIRETVATSPFVGAAEP